VSVHDLPSYPRQPGAREAERARAQTRPPQPGDDLPSYPGRPPAAEDDGSSPLARVLLVLLALAAVGLIAYAVTRESAVEPEGDEIMARLVVAMDEVELSLSTAQPAVARQYVLDEFGWRVGVPMFDAASLSGVGIATVAPAIDLPVFLYADDEERSAAVFVLNYVLLDQVPDRLHLAREDYERLAAEPRPHHRTVRSQEVVFWRDRGDIYVAVTEIPSRELAGNIQMMR
jgi:hypothetical protein